MDFLFMKSLKKPIWKIYFWSGRLVCAVCQSFYRHYFEAAKILGVELCEHWQEWQHELKE